MERRVVESAAARLADPGQDLVLAVGEVRLQPADEVVGHRTRQPEEHERGVASARFGGGGQDRGDLLVVQGGDHGRDEDTDRDAGIGQPAHRVEATGGDGGARLHHPAQAAPQGGHRDVDVRAVVESHLAQDIDVPGDEVVLGDDRDRVHEIAQHLEAAAREFEPPLDRLVGVGDSRDGQHPRPPGAPGERGAEQLGRTVLDEDPALEVESGRESQVLVGRPGVAVDAAVLAAAVGVERCVEAQIRTSVPGYDRPGAVRNELGPGPFFAPVPGFHFDMDRFETVRRVVRYSTALEREVHGKIAHPPSSAFIRIRARGSATR